MRVIKRDGEGRSEESDLQWGKKEREAGGGRRGRESVVFQRGSQHVNMDFIAVFRIGPHSSSLSTMSSSGPHTQFIYCGASCNMLH